MTGPVFQVGKGALGYPCEAEVPLTATRHASLCFKPLMTVISHILTDFPVIYRIRNVISLTSHRISGYYSGIEPNIRLDQETPMDIRLDGTYEEMVQKLAD